MGWGGLGWFAAAATATATGIGGEKKKKEEEITHKLKKWTIYRAKLIR